MRVYGPLLKLTQSYRKMYPLLDCYPYRYTIHFCLQAAVGYLCTHAPARVRSQTLFTHRMKFAVFIPPLA